MLEFLNVAKVYRGGVRGVDGVTMRLGPGLVGLLGPNGAGKSSLIRIGATVTGPSSGQVLFDGTDAAPSAINVAGAIAVAFTPVVNLARGYPLLSMAATAAVAATRYALWVRAGRPAGIEEVERHLGDDG